MREIVISKRFSILVDAADFDFLNSMNWVVKKSGHTYYARTHHEGTGRTMHSLLCDCPSNMVIDHINGNGLDNRRDNLRAVHRGVNRISSKLSSNNTSGFRGVIRGKTPGTWAAAFQYREFGKIVRKHLGTFKSPQAASDAYINAVYAKYGKFHSRGW